MDNILAAFLAGGPRCPLCEHPFSVMRPGRASRATCKNCCGVVWANADRTYRRLTTAERAALQRDVAEGNLPRHVTTERDELLPRMSG